MPGDKNIGKNRQGPRGGDQENVERGGGGGQQGNRMGSQRGDRMGRPEGNRLGGRQGLHEDEEEER